jgi:hypothetical protein
LRRFVFVISGNSLGLIQIQIENIKKNNFFLHEKFIFDSEGHRFWTFEHKLLLLVPISANLGKIKFHVNQTQTSKKQDSFKSKLFPKSFFATKKKRQKYIYQMDF